MKLLLLKGLFVINNVTYYTDMWQYMRVKEVSWILMFLLRLYYFHLHEPIFHKHIFSIIYLYISEFHYTICLYQTATFLFPDNMLKKIVPANNYHTRKAIVETSIHSHYPLLDLHSYPFTMVVKDLYNLLTTKYKSSSCLLN